MPSANYLFVRDALLQRKAISATYEGERRFLCPHIIGHDSTGKEMALFYQYDGGSSGRPGPDGSKVNWRCLAVKDLRDLTVVEGERWHTASDYSGIARAVPDVDVRV